VIALDGIALGALIDAVTSMDVVDLGHDCFVGMPVAPVHAPYVFTLARRHGDAPRDDGTATANEVVLLSGHTGTHIDAFGHAAADDRLHGGLEAGETTTGGALKALGVETVAPIVCRGVLLDVAALHGVDCLPPAYEVTVGDLERASERAGTEVAAGDAVLVRTGWATRWPDQDRFVSGADGTPGPGAAAARWLADRGVRLGGSDTLTFEVVSPAANRRPVHALFLVERGIHIVEALNLEPLAARSAGVFVFVASPLRLVGATGSPIRPMALLPGATNGSRR
jgi:kynurenine formamidase